jgi:hypothetical protein
MQPSDYLKQISAEGSTIVSGVSEIAKAEILPSVKGVAIGSGLFGGAAFFGYTSLKIGGLATGFLISWIFNRFVGLSVLMSLFVGFIIMTVLGFLVTGLVAWLGAKQFGKAKEPKTAMNELKQSLATVGPSVEAGVQDAQINLANAHEIKQSAKRAAQQTHLVVDPIVAARQRRAAAKAEKAATTVA